MIGIDEETAISIVLLNDIKCCRLCEFYDSYDHDLGSEWHCKESVKELDDEDWINVFKLNRCKSFVKNIDKQLERNNG